MLRQRESRCFSRKGLLSYTGGESLWAFFTQNAAYKLSKAQAMSFGVTGWNRTPCKPASSG